MTRHTHILGTVIALLVAGSAAHADTLISDPFTDGARTDGADALDTDWWLNVIDTSTSSEPTTVANDATIGSGNSLAVDATNTSGGSSSRIMVGSFETQTLGHRDKLILEFDFRLGDNALGNERFRFGLLDDGGDPFAADVDSAKTEHEGYFTRISAGVGNDNSDTRQSNPTVTNIISGSNTAERGANDTLGGIDDTAAHSARFTVTYTDDFNDVDVDLRTRIDNRFQVLGRDLITPVTSFNEVAIGSVSGLDYAFDNVRVERWTASIDDTFDVGGVPTRGDDVDDPLDVGWVSRSDVTLSVVDDDNNIADANTGEIAAGNALSVDTDGTFAKMGASMHEFDLSLVGSKANVSFDVRFTDDPAGASDNDGFRFGLWDDAGTALVDGDTGFNAADNDDDGYLVSLGLGTAGAKLEIEADAGGILGGGGDPDVGTGTFAGIADLDQHFVELMLERVADGMRFTLSIDGTQVFDLTDTLNSVNIFNQIGFASNGEDFLIDNVVVDAMQVPTPAALPMALVLMGAIASRRKRA